MTITLTPVSSLLTPSDTRFANYKSEIGITRIEGWGDWPDHTLWVVDDENSARLLSTWVETLAPQDLSDHSLPVGMWKRRTTVTTSNLANLWDLLQECSEWKSTFIVERKIVQASEAWEHSNRDAVLEQGYEASGLPPRACCQICNCRKPAVVSGVRDKTVNPAQTHIT